MAINKIHSDRSENKHELREAYRLKPNQPPPNDSFKNTYTGHARKREEDKASSSQEKKEAKEPDSLEEKTSTEPGLTQKELAKPKKSESPSPSLFDLSKKNASTKTAPPFMENADLAKDAAIPSSDNLSSLDQPLDPLSQSDELMKFLNETSDGSMSKPSSNVAQEAKNGSVDSSKAPPEPALDQLRAVRKPYKQPSKESDDLTGKKESLSPNSKKDKPQNTLESASGDVQQRSIDPAMINFNTSTQSVELQSNTTSQSENTASSATIQNIANQLVDRIQIMRKGGEINTTITLRHPPILDGATITLTAFDHAKREFNISFGNLSPEAKMLLDRKLNENSLTEILERKGIIVHIVSTSTEPVPILEIEAGHPPSDQEEQRRERRQAEPEEDS